MSKTGGLLIPHSSSHNLPSERKMADFKTELFFLGQIVGGSDFPTDLDGLFVEASLKYGADNWHLFPADSTKASLGSGVSGGGSGGAGLQTHTAYCDDEGFFVWAHPFDFHFTCESVQGW